MDVCAWVSVCVHGGIAKEGILSSAFLTSVRLSRGTHLSILVRRSRAVPACTGRKDEGSWQLGVRL